jgi:hypothetical protein
MLQVAATGAQAGNDGRRGWGKAHDAFRWMLGIVARRLPQAPAACSPQAGAHATPHGGL